MADEKHSPEQAPQEEKPSERFEALTRRLLGVSKDAVREAEAREQEKRRPA